MKIGYLTNQYPKISHTFIRREIRALSELGVEVHRFSVRGAPEELEDEADRQEAALTRVLLDDGAKGLMTDVSRVLLTRPGRFSAALRLAAQLSVRAERGPVMQAAYLAEACRLVLWCEEARIEHLHVHFGTNPTTVALLAAALGGPSYSFTVHGPEEFDKAHLIHLREKILAAKFVVAISDYGRSQLYRLLPFSEWSKVHVVRCGVDSSYLDASPPPIVQRHHLVCVGRLSEQKGQMLLVEALAQLRDEGSEFELTLVGDGELRENVESLIRERSLEGVVKITGWASGDAVRAHLAAASALVLPSFAEGLPVVIMEALALGRPVLSTYVAGIPELVRPGQSGWLVPAGSVPELKKGITTVLATPVPELERLGREGRQLVEAEHNVRSNAMRLSELFKSA